MHILKLLKLLDKTRSIAGDTVGRTAAAASSYRKSNRLGKISIILADEPTESEHGTPAMM